MSGMASASRRQFNYDGLDRTSLHRINDAMKTSFGRILFLFAMMAAAANFAWAVDVSPIKPLGNETYTITVSSHNLFSRDTEALKARALQEATKFCAKVGKKPKVVSVNADKSLIFMGDFSQATLTFKALDVGDPELGSEQPTIPGQLAVPASPATEQLYSDLIRLDDLHKKGILTDAEYETEKKKVLNRSK